MTVANVRPPPYELFFAPLEVRLNPTELESVRTAYIFSKFGHAKQRREDGSRYFDHPKGVAWIYIQELKGRDHRAVIDMLLHDLQEDCYLLSAYRIKRNFGKEVALDVRALTKLPKGKEDTPIYLGRVIERGPWAILTKLVDRLHNLRTLGDSTPEKQQRQIQETKTHHLPMLIPALRSYGGEWAVYADQLETKIHDVIKPYEASIA